MSPSFTRNLHLSWFRILQVCQVAVIIFDILHESGTSGSGVSNESSESKCIGSWNGASHACIAHENFDKAAIVESICSYCVRDFRETNYTTGKFSIFPVKKT